MLAAVPPVLRATTAMQAYVDAMQPGWNLGNTLDAVPTETSWGNPLVTRDFIQEIADQGFQSIRIPVTWKDHHGAGPGYTIDPEWMNRVQQIVDWSLDADLHVMLNLHHDSDWVRTMPTDHDGVLNRFNALWQQIAARFADYPDELMFESINEPAFEGASDATAMTLLDELNSSFHTIVRGSGGRNATRPLVLPTVVTNASQVFLDSLATTVANLDDSNLIVTVHFYGFWPFSVNIAGSTTFGPEVIDGIESTIDRVDATFVSRGIPAVIGEYGLLGFDNDNSPIEHGEMLKYFEYFTAYAQAHGIAHMIWDNGQHFDRNNYVWRDPSLYDVVMHSVSGRSSTAETDLLFLRHGQAVEDVAIDLNLNGNTFVALYDGSGPLVAGLDYVLDGSLLTVKASLLARYASGSLGEKAVLSARFDAGPDWKIHVRRFSPPLHGDATGTKTGGLDIPTAFNGDRLATMEAVYAGGGNAGPPSWSSYKQFKESFVPNYPGGAIRITPEFFAETTTGTVNLTFHYWSGQTREYQLIIDGAGAVAGVGDGDIEITTGVPAYGWAPFTIGAAGTWTPTGVWVEPGLHYTASDLPAWASIDPASGVVSGTPPTVAAGTIAQATISVTSGGQALGEMKLNLVVPTPGATLAPVNMATRGLVGLGEQALALGFVVGGDSPRDFLIRAVGPTIGGEPYNVGGTLPDPLLTIYNQQGTILDSNDNWGDADDPARLVSTAAAAGAFSLNAESGDAALLVTLNPGLYSARATGVADGTGVALVEFYDVTSGSSNGTLLNISTSARVGTGDEVLIPGLVLRGGGTRRLLVRAVGPTLAEYDVQDVLANPHMTLIKDGQVLATNDDWATGTDAEEIKAVAATVGAFPLPESSRDAVLLATLPEGAYSVVLRGVGDTSGIALLEVYLVP